MLVDVILTVVYTIFGGLVAGILTSVAWFPLLNSPARQLIDAAPVDADDRTEAYLEVMMTTTLVLSILTVGGASIRPPTMTPYVLVLIPVGFTLFLWTALSYPFPFRSLPLFSSGAVPRADWFWFKLGIVWYGGAAGFLTLLLAANITATRFVF